MAKRTKLEVVDIVKKMYLAKKAGETSIRYTRDVSCETICHFADKGYIINVNGEDLEIIF